MNGYLPNEVCVYILPKYSDTVPSGEKLKDSTLRKVGLKAQMLRVGDKYIIRLMAARLRETIKDSVWLSCISVKGKKR